MCHSLTQSSIVAGFGRDSIWSGWVYPLATVSELRDSVTAYNAFAASRSGTAIRWTTAGPAAAGLIHVAGRAVLSHSCRVPSVPSSPKTQLPHAQRAKFLLISSFLAVFAALDTVHNYVGLRGEGVPISVGMTLWWGAAFWLPYFLLVPAAVYLVERYPPDFVRSRSFVIHGVAGLVFAYLHVLMVAIRPIYSNRSLAYAARAFNHLRFEFTLDYSLYCCIVAGAYLFQRYSTLKEREVRASQLEASVAQTHLRAIQAQLNPHFFFNTLQAISVLALAGERDSVVEMLSRLSNLIRVSFDAHRPQHIALSAEMEFLTGYLSIHQLSFGQRLTIHYDVAPDTLDASVPAMLLQPLVENAIMHGIARKPGAGTIHIATRRRADMLVLEVADSGCGFPTGLPRRKGIGLSATESRLQLLYGGAHNIEYGRSSEGGADVTVTIPFSLLRNDPLARAAHEATT
jgi:two-component system LytT family sensor kinase